MPWQLSLWDALTTCEMRSKGKVCVCVRTLYSYYTSNVCTIKLDNTPGESSSWAFAPLCPAVSVRHVRQWALNKAILIFCAKCFIDWSSLTLSSARRYGDVWFVSEEDLWCTHRHYTFSIYSSCKYEESCRFVCCVYPHTHTMHSQ